jgi:RNA polymerase sigma-70 factor (ECF subfamily)
VEGEANIQDRFLIHEAQAGSHAAFEQLVHTHDQAVLKLALRITKSQSDAQDIYQEAFLKAFRKLEGFRFECSFSSWIYRITTNVCLDYLRKNRSRREYSAIMQNADGEEFDLLSQLPDDRPAHNPEQQMFGRELRTHIVRALEELTPRERMVFELRHFQGLKLKTVGEILNTSEASTKNSLFRATKKLRVQLAGCAERRDVRYSNVVMPRMLKV